MQINRFYDISITSDEFNKLDQLISDASNLNGEVQDYIHQLLKEAFLLGMKEQMHVEGDKE